MRPSRSTVLPLVMVCLGAAVFLPRPAFPQPAVPTVAVVPVTPPDAAGEVRDAEHAVRRVLTDRLVSLGAFRVVSYREAERAAAGGNLRVAGRSRHAALRQVGLALGADVVLAVHMDMPRGKWRIRSTLCEVATARVRAGPSATVPYADVGEVLATILETTAERAGVVVPPEQGQHLRRMPTPDGAAFLALGAALRLPTGSATAEMKALEAVRRDPEFVEGHVELGRTYFARKDFDLALAAYERAREIAPGYPNVDYNLGLTYRALGDYSRAIEAYERARSAAMVDADVLNNLGVVYYLAGDLIRAGEVFRDALVLAPYDRRVRANLQTVEDAVRAPLLAPPQRPAEGAAETPAADISTPPDVPEPDAAPEPPADPRAFIEAAAILYANGEYEHAMEEYERAHERRPHDPDLLVRLGRTYQQLARHADAIGAFNQALERGADEVEVLGLLEQSLAALPRDAQQAAGALQSSRMGITAADVARVYYHKGKRHHVRAEYAQAIAAYIRALEFAPEHLELLNSLGVAQYEAGQTDLAEQTFARAMELAPDDAAVARNLEVLHAAQDRVRLRAAEQDGRLTLLQVEVDPELRPEIAFLEGNEAYAAGEYAAAEAAYLRALAEDPTHARARNNLGVTLVQLGRYGDAAEAFAGVQLDDVVVHANADAARVLLHYDSTGPDAQTMTLAIADDPDVQYQYRMALGKEAYEREDYEMAADIYETVAARYEHRATPLNNLAACHFMREAYDDAYAAVTLALRRDPEDMVALQNRDRIEAARYVAQLEAESATAPELDAGIVLAVEATTLAEHPGMDQAALEALARQHVAKEQWGDAAHVFALAAGRAPEKFGLAMEWGYAALKAQRARDARRAFAQATRLQPTSARAHYNLAVAERQAGDLAAAISACREAVRLDPDFIEAAYNLANFLLQSGAWRDAVTAFQQVLALDEANVGAYNNLAVAHWRLGESDEAERMWRAALAVDPDCESARANLDRLRSAGAAAGAG